MAAGSAGTCAYRSLEPVLHERLAAVLQRREADAPWIEFAQRVAARRIGRAWAGGVATAFGVAAFACGVARLRREIGSSAESFGTWATVLLLEGWLAGVVAGIVARVAASRWLASHLDAKPRLTGDATTDLAQLETADPRRLARDV